MEEDFFDEPIGIPETFSHMNRREFFKITGGGIIVFFSVGDIPTLEAQRGGLGYPSDFNAYLLIKEDGTVDCFTGKIEMGQGVITSLAQMAAEELEVTLESIKMIMGDTAICPYDRGTWGSMTTRFFGPALRAAAAKAKTVLLELAAEHLDAPVTSLTVENGVVSVKGRPSAVVNYGRLAKGKRITRTLQQDAVEKAVADFKTVGVPALRTDSRVKVTGEARFAGDIRYPGMLYARILRPPAHRARIKTLDTSAAEAMAGVSVVNQEDLVAVLHPDPEIAEKALKAIEAKYDIPEETVDDKNIFEHLLRVGRESEEVDKQGSVAEGEKLSVDIFEKTYYNSYVAHAPIEPHTAVANYEDGKIELWVSTQSPFGDRGRVASELGLTEDNVRVKTPFVGGGFGGKSRNIQAIEAARLSKITGKPVQVAWTREEEFFHDTFRPAAVVKIRSGIDAKGRIVLWDYKVFFAGSRGAGQFYDIPNNLIKTTSGGWGGGSGTHPFATGPWRAPGANTNVFSKESQIDIMAAKAGIDPLAFRLMNLKDERMIGVLKAVADKFGWVPIKAPSGRGVGLACGVDSGTYVATMAEVEVDKASGRVQVKRVACAQDMGLAINPAGAKIQMEGCITMGLGYALSEEVHFKGGKILDSNFDTYEIPRFSWVPKIETVLIEAKDSPAQGGGEPPIINMGGVIANAVFDATGARLYQLPMTPQRNRAAIKS